MSRAMRIYGALPAWARGLAASAHGARLRRLRYGAIFRHELPGFEQREGWSAERWHDHQRRALRSLLERAVEAVPYYRRLHASGTFPIEAVRTPADLPALPRLDKETVRERGRELLAADADTSCLYEEHTSGTTGTPLTLWWSPRTHQTWFACFERRVRGWAGVSRRDRWANLGGQLVVPQTRSRPPFWVWNAAGRQLYMSSYHLRPDYLDSYLDELSRRRIAYVYGYASSLAALAAHALDTGRSGTALRVAISNAEPFFEHQRRQIEAAFGCPTRDTYAPAELGVAATECEHGTLHLSPEIGVVEVLADDGSPAAPGEVGELVVTSLINRDHVLIRYRQGDRGALAPADRRCPCGRSMPILERIEGRADDVLVTPDGRAVGRLDPVFKADLPVREAQIVQRRPDLVEVLVVPGTGFDRRHEAYIAEALRQRMGPIEVRLQQVDAIARTERGKFRAVINEIPPA